MSHLLSHNGSVKEAGEFDPSPLIVKANKTLSTLNIAACLCKYYKEIMVVLFNSNGRYRYNDLVRPENQLLLNGTKMDWKSLVISDFVIPDLQNGQKWPKCPQNGFMIFVPSKLAKHVWPSCSVYKMQKKIL